jgi:hypothetical protein
MLPRTTKERVMSMTLSTVFEAYGGSAPENYERYFVPVISGPLAQELVVSAPIFARESVYWMLPAGRAP